MQQFEINSYYKSVLKLVFKHCFSSQLNKIYFIDSTAQYLTFGQSNNKHNNILRYVWTKMKATYAKNFNYFDIDYL